MSQHTVKAFDDELEQLRDLIAEMGRCAVSAVKEAIHALMQHDAKAAKGVILCDRQIDQLEAQVEQLAVQIIALRAPMANDLREVIAMLKIAGMIERIGDYAKNIAKRVTKMGVYEPIEALSLLPVMSDFASEMATDALRAFNGRNAMLAETVVARDPTVDNFYNSIFRALVTYMVENQKTIGTCAHLLFIAKNIERIGDHATNMAEMAYYAATGGYMPARGRETEAEG